MTPKTYEQHEIQRTAFEGEIKRLEGIIQMYEKKPADDMNRQFIAKFKDNQKYLKSLILEQAKLNLPKGKCSLTGM